MTEEKVLTSSEVQIFREEMRAQFKKLIEIMQYPPEQTNECFDREENTCASQEQTALLQEDQTEIKAALSQKS